MAKNLALLFSMPGDWYKLPRRAAIPVKYTAEQGMVDE
jgi:hypothetical protein